MPNASVLPVFPADRREDIRQIRHAGSLVAPHHLQIPEMHMRYSPIWDIAQNAHGCTYIPLAASHMMVSCTRFPTISSLLKPNTSLNCPSTATISPFERKYIVVDIGISSKGLTAEILVNFGQSGDDSRLLSSITRSYLGWIWTGTNIDLGWGFRENRRDNSCDWRTESRDCAIGNQKVLLPIGLGWSGPVRVVLEQHLTFLKWKPLSTQK